MNRTTIDPIILSTIGIVFPIVSVIWIFLNLNLESILTLYLTSLFTAIHITIFAHRAWTHKAWIPNPIVKIYGLFVFTVMLVGNSIGWVSVHREHHRHTDTDKDPHSPFFKSRLRIQFLSYYNEIKIQYITDLIRDKHQLLFAKHYWTINLTLFLILFLIDPNLLFFWIAVLGLQSVKMHTINSLSHNTPNFLLPINNTASSSNSLIVTLLNISSGEAWHKNHHEDPKNWNFSKRWYEIDPPAWVIKTLVLLGLAKFNHE